MTQPAAGPGILTVAACLPWVATALSVFPQASRDPGPSLKSPKDSQAQVLDFYTDFLGGRVYRNYNVEKNKFGFCQYYYPWSPGVMALPGRLGQILFLWMAQPDIFSCPLGHAFRISS